MLSYIKYFAIFLASVSLLSGCGVVAMKNNISVLENYPIGTSEKVMKEKLTEGVIGSTKCDVVATITTDGNSKLEACPYTLTLNTSRVLTDNYVYFYKGKYVGHGDKRVFSNNFVKQIEKEKNPIFASTIEGNSDEVAVLLEKGINPNIPSEAGTFPLLEAVFKQDTELVEMLLENGADPNVTNKHGVSSLMFAATKDNVDILSNLIKHGAKLDRRSNLGHTPLMSAVLNNKINMVKKLVTKGADLNISETEHGTTPLLQAGIKRYYEIADYLVKSNANIDIPGNNGVTVRQHAINTNDNRLLKILKFNPELITLEKIESDYDEELVKYQQLKKDNMAAENEYAGKELKFLTGLSDEKLESYSIYTDNFNNNSTNIAKVLLSFRKFSNSLNKNEKDNFVELYSEKQSLKIDADLLAKMDQNLTDRKQVIADLKKEIVEADKKAAFEEKQAKEAAYRNQQQVVAAQNAQAAQRAQNTIGMLSILTTGLNTYNSIQTQKYNAQAQAYRTYSNQYESNRKHRELIDSINGIEDSITRARRGLY